MKPMMILGVVLIVLGVGALVVPNISWTQRETVAEIGPVEINADRERSVWIPAAASIAAIFAGLGLVVAGRKAA
jgi:hypothetical protein